MKRTATTTERISRRSLGCALLRLEPGVPGAQHAGDVRWQDRSNLFAPRGSAVV